MKEEWRDIDGFEGYYQVSSFGRIRSLDRTVKYSDGRVFSYKGIILKTENKIGNSGYNNVVLSVSGKQYYSDIHVLVAKAFVPNPENKPWVNHKDGNKLNNNKKNLEWVTKSENVIHALEKDLTPHGEKCSWSKLNNKQILEIYELSHNTKMRHVDIAKKYNISKGTVSKIKLGTTGKRITKHKD